MQFESFVHLTFDFAAWYSRTCVSTFANSLDRICNFRGRFARRSSYWIASRWSTSSVDSVSVLALHNVRNSNQCCDRKTWRSTWYLLTGLSALCFVGGAVTIDKDLPSTEKDRCVSSKAFYFVEDSELYQRRIDWIGAFLVTVGLIMIVFVLSEGSIAPHGWKTNCECASVFNHMCYPILLLDIIALIVVGVVLLIAFVLWEHYLEVCMDMESEKDVETTASFWTPPPLMRISIWSRARGKLGVMLVVACVDWCSFMSFTFWQTVCPFICPLIALTDGDLQLYYQNYLELSPVLTMIRQIPMFTTIVGGLFKLHFCILHSALRALLM